MKEDFDQFPDFVDQMFKDRAFQFRDRLGWPVDVDDKGWETDQYDLLDPLYVMVKGSDGSHIASAI